MSDQITNFGNVAQKLARNPLGIIALFIVLVYGFAALASIHRGNSDDRFPVAGLGKLILGPVAGMVFLPLTVLRLVRVPAGDAG